MSERTSTLTFLAKDAASGPIKAIDRAMDKLGARARNLGDTLGKVALVGVGALAAGAALAGPKLLGIATKLEQIGAKAKTVFGDQIGQVTKWGKANATAMGLTSAQAVGLAANFGDLLVPMGFTRAEAARMSTDVVGLSGALAQWSGGTRTAAEVSAILAKAMLGERDGLKELGISINDADVKARLLKNGTSELTGAQLEQAKATATQQLIFEKSADAQAAYAAGGDTLIGTQAKIGAKIAELVETFATGLIPAFQTVTSVVLDRLIPAITGVIDGIGAWVAANQPILAQLQTFGGGAIDLFVKGLDSIVKVFTDFGPLPAIIAGVTLAMLALNVAVRANPIVALAGAIIVAIGLLREAWDSDFGGMRTTIVNVARAIEPIMSGIGFLMGGIFKAIATTIGLVVTAIGAVITKLGELVAFIRENIDTLSQLAGFLTNPGGTGVRIGQDIGRGLTGKAAGGPVLSGRSYVVGERGPELLHMGSNSGSVTPNSALGGTTNVTINVNGTTDLEATARAVMQAFQRERLRQGLSFG